MSLGVKMASNMFQLASESDWGVHFSSFGTNKSDRHHSEDQVSFVFACFLIQIFRAKQSEFQQSGL